MLKKRKKTVRSSTGWSPNKGVVDCHEETEKARKVAMSLCRAEGFELIHLEYKNEPKGRVLRVYISKPEGITLDDCANLSINLSDVLDIEWSDCGSYHLEVSSPGIEHSLNKLDDFTHFCGGKVMEEY